MTAALLTLSVAETAEQPSYLLGRGYFEGLRGTCRLHRLLWRYAAAVRAGRAELSLPNFNYESYGSPGRAAFRRGFEEAVAGYFPARSFELRRGEYETGERNPAPREKSTAGSLRRQLHAGVVRDGARGPRRGPLRFLALKKTGARPIKAQVIPDSSGHWSTP
jgi:hypothetical protein